MAIQVHELKGQAVRGLTDVPGRDTWYAGAALIDGKLLGPPLGIRSMTATCDGGALLANVHVRWHSALDRWRRHLESDNRD